MAHWPSTTCARVRTHSALVLPVQAGYHENDGAAQENREVEVNCASTIALMIVGHVIRLAELSMENAGKKKRVLHFFTLGSE